LGAALAAFQVLALAALAFLFVKNVVGGQVSDATALSAQQRDEIRVATNACGHCCAR
jgi:hypothetical protein